jgi:ubiquinone/menaquinone biosynthesis C-methylase UbiE
MAQMEMLLAGTAEPQAAPAEHQQPRAGYALWAATYDRPGNPIVEVEEPAVQAILDRLAPGLALDVACGTGRHARFLGARGHRVVGVDASPEMLREARAKTSGVGVVTASLLELPLLPAAFDAAVCALALTHVDDLPQAVSELARVVRPGGRIVISDLHPQLVALGAHAGFVGLDGGRHFVVNLIHLHSRYLAAFESSELRVRACLEPELADATLGLSGALQRVPDAARQALAGIPALLVWDLEKVPG